MVNSLSQSCLKKVMKMQSKSHGVVHWKLQRISAIAMIPLISWFVSSLVFGCSLMVGSLACTCSPPEGICSEGK